MIRAQGLLAQIQHGRRGRPSFDKMRMPDPKDSAYTLPKADPGRSNGRNSSSGHRCLASHWFHAFEPSPAQWSVDIAADDHLHLRQVQVSTGSGRLWLELMD
jgi:hypothetical protein